ncbi:MAG: hypothetical protein FWF84_01145 [Kiritimatiellaeota bacterium]|nr:hypothetical protein [Kiritimatiellota bacterium]
MKHIMTFGVALAAAGALAETVEIKAECAGMSAFRKFWDLPIVVAEDGERIVTDEKVKEWGLAAVWGGEKPGPLAFDAVNRMLLVRFPGAAEAIAEKLKEGYVIEKAEVALTHLDEELWPMGNGQGSGWDTYFHRRNWGVEEKYHAQRPNWHAVAYALRKPWMADAEMGPTLNAAVNGAVYWKRFGASDVKEDRFAKRFGPTEVSSYNPNGRMDITEALTGAEFGKGLGERLRQVSDCGFVVSKQEVYDHRYYSMHYEWETSTGPRAIVVKEPKLIVTFAKGKAEKVSLKNPADVAGMAAKVKKGGKPSGAPSVVLPSKEQVAAWNAKFQAKPAWMEAWQYDHVKELMTLGKGTVEPFYCQLIRGSAFMGGGQFINQIRDRMRGENPDVPQIDIDYQHYLLWVDHRMSRPPRFWDGHLTAAEDIVLWYNYREAMLPPMVDLFMLNWTAWLMPERKSAPLSEMVNFENTTGELIHTLSDWPNIGKSLDGQRRPEWGDNWYYKLTGDWQGNRGFYRSSMTRTMSTQNFNYNASAGALLLGQVIGSEYAIDDGRHGLMHFPFWLWTYGVGGVSQEYIDHYYWSITMAGNKLFPDYAEALQDQMAGWSILEKNMEDLVGAYHPNLRKLIGPASRTIYDCVLGRMEGLQLILHTLSPSGTLTDTETGKLPWMSKDEAHPSSAWGEDFPPLSVAKSTLSGPWTDAWMSEVVDAKPLPWSLYAQKDGRWVTTYFGENYGLASIVNELNHGHTPQRIHVLGHWRRVAEQPKPMTDVGTFDIRVGFNPQTRFVDDVGGGTVTQQGTFRNSQHRNKLITMARPNMNVIKEVAASRPEGERDIKSVQASVALFNFEQPGRTWEIYVDRQKVAIPAAARFGQVITIKDGTTYLAIRPIDGGTVGRDMEVSLDHGVQEVSSAHGHTAIAAELIINAFFFKRCEGAALSEEEIAKLGTLRGGFVIEMGDEKEYGNFGKFQEAMLAAKCEVAFGDNSMKVTYASDNDTLEAEWVPENDHTPVFTVNGASPYPDRAVWRDTNLSQLAKTARLEKNGAVIERETVGNLLLLQTFPKQKITVAMNPLPTYQAYTFTTPDGVHIAADGLLSMGRWVVKGNTLDIRYCAFDDDTVPADQRATSLLVTGMKDTPAVTLNGADITAFLKKDGDTWRIPLTYIVRFY